MTLPWGSPRRRVLAYAPLRRIVGVHLITVVCEWGAGVGILVHAYARGGATATGLASLAILAPSLLGAPLAAVITDRYPPLAVRRAGQVVQAAGFAGATVAVATHAPLALSVAMVVVALGAITLLRPTGAIVLPATVRSPGELTVANLWISYCESASALVGPLVAAGLAGIGGPATVLGACALGSIAGSILASIDVAAGPPAGNHHAGAGLRRPLRTLGTAGRSLATRPRNLGILAVAGARNVLIGAFDVLLVVIAFDRLELGDSGAGLLGSLVGAGALASIVVTTIVAHRTHLTTALSCGLGAAAALCIVLGASSATAVTIVALPAIGLCASLLDNLGRILLQRSADPRSLGAVFALIDFVAGLGLLVGSALAQVLLAVGGIEAAMYGIGIVLVAVLGATIRSLRLADHDAEVPVVEMSLLHGLPMFEPLGPLALEIVARSANHLEVAADTTVIRQGDIGDRFYAVVDGAFEITMTGTHVRTARRGSFFGEVSLLAGVPRTATVTAIEPGRLLAIDRVPFLIGVTGSDTSHAAAWGVVRALELDVTLPLEEGPDPSSPLHRENPPGPVGGT